MYQDVIIDQPYNGKIRFLQVFFIALTILGFETFSFVSSGYGQNSNIFSIIYRVFYLILGIIAIKKYWLKGRPKLSKSLFVIFIFWTLYLLRAIYDTTLNPNAVKTMIPEFWAFAFLLSFIPIFPLIINVNLTTLNYAKKSTLILAVIVNILGLKNNIILSSQDLLTRFSANEILNSVTYGQSGVILIILSFTSFLNQRLILRFVYLLLICLGLANIGLAASRGPVIQLLIVLFFYFIVNYKSVKISALLILVPLMLITVYSFRDYFYLFDSVIERLKTTSLNEERPELFLDSWRHFVENPIIGSRAIGEYAHNIFLGSLEALGILGGVLIFIIYINALKESITLAKMNATDWIALLLVMQLIASLMAGAIWNSFLLWALLALVSNLFFHRSLYMQSDQNGILITKTG